MIEVNHALVKEINMKLFSNEYMTDTELLVVALLHNNLELQMKLNQLRLEQEQESIEIEMIEF